MLLCHVQLVRPSRYKILPVTSTVKLSRATKVGVFFVTFIKISCRLNLGVFYHGSRFLFHIFIDNTIDVSGLLDEMMQKIHQLNESQSQEKERVTKLEGWLKFLSPAKGYCSYTSTVEYQDHYIEESQF